jgi:hypothetical protein
MNAFWESACDPIYSHRHPHHIELDAPPAGSASAGARPVLLSTNTMSSTAAISFVANRWEG